MDKTIGIHFSTGVKYNSAYYLTAIHMNALFMYNINKKKLIFLTSFQKEKKREYLYLKAFLYKNEAWFIPNQAEYIAIVNLDTYYINYMPLDYQKCYNDKGIKYINILHFNEKYLCLIPWDIDATMIIDLENKSMASFHGIVDQKKKYHDAIFIDNKIYFFPWNGKDILALDLKTNQRADLPSRLGEENFGDVVYNKKNRCLFHAPAKDNYILIDNLNGNICKKIRLDYWNDRKCKTFYSTEVMNDIFFWGHEKNVVLKIDKNDNSMKKYIINSKYSNKYFYPICSDDIEALVYNGNCIIKYNKDKDDFTYLYLTTTFDELMREMQTQNIDFMEIIEKKSLIENDIYNLIYILSCELNIKVEEKGKNIGNSIYYNIMYEPTDK